MKADGIGMHFLTNKPKRIEAAAINKGSGGRDRVAYIDDLSCERREGSEVSNG
jgi:hypothetical protein